MTNVASHDGDFSKPHIPYGCVVYKGVQMFSNSDGIFDCFVMTHELKSRLIDRLMRASRLHCDGKLPSKRFDAMLDKVQAIMTLCNVR